jgi:hypothetical protein
MDDEDILYLLPAPSRVREAFKKIKEEDGRVAGTERLREEHCVEIRGLRPLIGSVSPGTECYRAIY